ncbi:MAG: hypothetical protein NXI20_09800 [bacterium]|nr:hypothetical protein [bacterium]
MPALAKNINSDSVIIKRRFDDHLYAINPYTYNHIIDTIRLYKESIYLLPDFEQIDAIGADDENDSKRYRIKLNEVIFV